jgi:hypothetical protein
MYMHASVSWFRGKTLHSVLEQKKYIFLKSYAIACIAPSLTRILNRTILYSTHTHLTCSFKHNINQDVYTYIHRPLTKLFLSWHENNIPCFTYFCLQNEYLDCNARTTNPLTGQKRQHSIDRHSVIYSTILNLFPSVYLAIFYQGRAIFKTLMPCSAVWPFTHPPHIAK